jgi:ABC-2 type transport system ATP-binding protein
MSGLDPVGRREVRDLILSLKRSGKTVLFSSHVLPDVEALCDRVAILVRGRVRRVGGVRDLAAPGHHGYEIETEELPEGLWQRWHRDDLVRRHGDRVVLRIPSREDLDWRLRQLLDANVSILSVRPVAASLEDVFLSELRRDQDEHPESGASIRHHPAELQEGAA